MRLLVEDSISICRLPQSKSFGRYIYISKRCIWCNGIKWMNNINASIFTVHIIWSTKNTVFKYQARFPNFKGWSGHTWECIWIIPLLRLAMIKGTPLFDLIEYRTWSFFHCCTCMWVILYSWTESSFNNKGPFILTCLNLIALFLLCKLNQASNVIKYLNFHPLLSKHFWDTRSWEQN